MALAEIAAGASLLSGALSFGSGKSAKKAARRAAAEAARQERVVTDERIRQLTNEERTLAGMTRARAAGSGAISSSGSVLQLLAEQAREFAIERRVVRSAGASRAKLALDQGAAAGKQFEAQGLASLFQGIGSAINTGYATGLLKKVP